MSKIGKKPIAIPQGVEIKIDGDLVSVKGPKGTLQKTISKDVVMVVDDNQVKITLALGASKDGKVFWGLSRALIQNMIIGTTTGFEKILEFQGVGYKATVKGSDLELGLGYSHPVIVKGAEGIIFTTDKNSIKIQGIDKELIGKIAANIRIHRLPEPYKGSGIRYQGEVIKRKAGKKAATAA